MAGEATDATSARLENVEQPPADIAGRASDEDQAVMILRRSIGILVHGFYGRVYRGEIAKQRWLRLLLGRRSLCLADGVSSSLTLHGSSANRVRR
jgi:hypothetical protein